MQRTSEVFRCKFQIRLDNALTGQLPSLWISLHRTRGIHAFLGLVFGHDEENLITFVITLPSDTSSVKVKMKIHRYSQCTSTTFSESIHSQ